MTYKRPGWSSANYFSSPNLSFNFVEMTKQPVKDHNLADEEEDSIHSPPGVSKEKKTAQRVMGCSS